MVSTTEELLQYKLEPIRVERVKRQTPLKTNDLYIIADFNSSFENQYSGLRNMNLIDGITESLEDDYNVIRIDIGKTPEKLFKNKDIALSRLIGQIEGVNIFVIQNKYAIKNDLGFSKTIYFHLDGPERIGSKRLKFGFKIYNSAGGYDYPIGPHYKHLYPFVFLDKFNHDKHKDITISCIDRNCSFKEYKDILERSQFTVIDCRDWNTTRVQTTITSKRVFQALACKTIPIIIGDEDSVYKKLGIENNIAMFMNHFIKKSFIAYQYDPIMANRGYELMKSMYSGKRRMKIIKRVCKRIYDK